jgi:hypothetical protein
MSVYRTEIISYLIIDIEWYNTGHTRRFEHDNLRVDKCCAITENKNTASENSEHGETS